MRARGSGVRLWPIRHRQERAGSFLSQPAERRRRRGRPFRSLLRARVGAVQGARRRGRQPVAVPAVVVRSQQRELLPPESWRCRGSSRSCCGFPPSQARAGSGSRGRRTRSVEALAFEALRESSSVSRNERLVIAIDDLQWADVDGVLLLEELLRPPVRRRSSRWCRSAAKKSPATHFCKSCSKGGDRGLWRHSARADAGLRKPASSSVRCFQPIAARR